jgi:outer membrane lipopolysaccharide assembly protein LptE/RlpB
VIRSKLLLVIAFTSAGCGYHFHGTQPTLPSDIRTLAVGSIENKSRERGLEKQLAFAFEREVFTRRHYRVAQSRGGADAVLNGTIREVTRRPIAFDDDDQAVQYEVRLRLDFTLTRQRDGKTLWSVRDMREFDEYTANADVILTSSPEFQLGRLDKKNLDVEDDTIPDSMQITTIQLAEHERQRAMDRLLQRAVRDVYDRMIEGF